MAGITSIGAYIPVYRLSRDEIAKAWGTRSSGGEKVVANYDEDSLTMAVGAALNCLEKIERVADGLFFATTSAPYKEKQAATLIATAIDLARESRTADYTDSLRASTLAMNSAIDAVECGSAQHIVVTASDCRIAAAHSELEQGLSDGAAAIAIGNSDAIATIEGRYSVFDEFTDFWRAEEDTFIRSWEGRFINTQGYISTVSQAVSGLMNKYGLAPGDFAKAVLYGPDARSHTAIARSLGFDLKTQIQDPLLTTIGNTGTASPLLMLATALEEAKPGDKILLASYGEGSDAFVLNVTKDIEKIQSKPGVKDLVTRKIPISYEKYMSWRNLVPIETPSRPENPVPSLTCLWRERKSNLALYGVKCKRCGTAQYPPQRVCAACQAKDEFEDYRFYGKKGRIFTYAIDYLTTSKNPPSITALIDFEGGGRMLREMTDCLPNEIAIDMPVEMTFRKLYELGGIHNYSWRARPASTF